MVYKPKSGGPPPSSEGGYGGGPGGKTPYGFGFYEALPSGKRKKVGLFRVEKGEKNVPFVFLDVAPVADGPYPSIRVHDGFKYNNVFGNIVICNGYRPEGCPMDKALESEHRCGPFCKPDCDRAGKIFPAKGAWRWVASGVKMKPFTYTKGPLKGTTIEHQRCLLLVSDFDKQYAQFEGFRESFDGDGGLRGRIFNVSRGPETRSPKIGKTWVPIGKMTDEEMMEKFEGSAGLYGLPVEQFIRPFDYEQVLSELSTEKMLESAQYVARERGVQLDEFEEDPPAAASSTADTEEEIEEEVPF